MKQFLLLLTLSFSMLHAQQFSRVDVYDGFLPTTISVDPANNLILAGEYLGTVDFDPGSGSTTLSVNTYEESAISKYDENGVFQWVSAISGGCDTSFFGTDPVPNNLIDVMDIDPSGNIYVGGRFCGTADFDPGSGTTNLTAFNAGGLNYRDAFLAKYDPSGNLVWAGLISGNGQEELNDLRIDASGNLFICGSTTQSADIDPGSGVSNISGGFFAKLDANGDLTWVQQFQGTPYGIDHVAPASDGAIYLTGNFRSTVDFDPGPGVFELTANNAQIDIFMAKFDSDGDFVWALSWEQSGEDEDQRDLQVDTTGHVYLSGYFRNTMDLDPGAGTFQLTSAGSSDEFIVKLDSSGAFVWAVRFGNSGLETGVDIEVENDGTINFMGDFDDVLDVDPGPGTLDLGDNSDISNVYFGKLDPDGNLIWGRAITGFYITDPYDLTIDGMGNLYYSGDFEGTVDFDPGPGENIVQGGTFTEPFGYVLRISEGGAINVTDEITPLTFLIYPNPTSGSFTIDLGEPVKDVEVSMSTLDGKSVWQRSYGRTSRISCDPDLASGMYLLKVEGKGRTPAYTKLGRK